MLVSNHRVYYLNSDMVVDPFTTTPGAQYHKTLSLPSFEEDYTHVSLLHAVIPNSFPTIQQDTNDTFEFVFTIGWNKDYGIEEPLLKTISKSLKIEEGFYDETQILHQINNNIRDLKYNDFGIGDYTKEPGKIVYVIEGQGDLFELDNYDDNQTCHIQVANNMNVIFYRKTPCYWIEKLEIFTKDLSYKILGIPKNNYYLCFSDYQLSDKPDNDNPDTYIDVLPYFFPFTKLPFRPTLVWVSSISIRLDIVNIIEDSNVLENIPVTDPELPFITYQNNDILNTSKKFNSTYTNGRINIQITQQNGYELNLDNIEFNLDIVVFKV